MKHWLSKLLVAALCMGLFAALALPGKALALRGGGASTADELEAALESAASGETVQLTADIEADEIAVPAGVTLDLNGNNLTVNALSADSGKLIDSANGTGMVKIAKDKPTLATNNPQFPVYDSEAEGYRLFNASVQLTAPYRKYVDEQPRLKGQYKLCFENPDAYGLLAQGGSGVTLTTEISYGEGTAVGGTCLFPDKLIKEYGTVYATKVFGLSFKNYLEDEAYPDYARKALKNTATFESCGVELTASTGSFKLETNLALTGAFTAYYQNINTTASYVTENINDGNTPSTYNDCAGFNYAEGGSIVVDLGQFCVLTGYDLYNCGEPTKYGGMKSWKLYASTDKRTWELVDTETDNAGGHYEQPFDDNVTARYLMLVATDAYPNAGSTSTTKPLVLRINEFEVYGWGNLPGYTLTYQKGGETVGQYTVPSGLKPPVPEMTNAEGEGVWVGWPDLPETMPEQDLTLEAETLEVRNLALGDRANGRNALVSATYALPNSTYKDLSRLTDLQSAEHIYDAGKKVVLSQSEDGYICIDLLDVCEVTGYRMDQYKWPVQYGGIVEWSVYGSLTRDTESWFLLDSERTNFNIGKNSDGSRTITDGIDFTKPVEARYIWLKATEVHKGTGTTTDVKPNENMHLCEFQVWGNYTDTPNLAAASRGTRVTSTFKSEDTNFNTAEGKDYRLSAINDGIAQFDTQNYTKSVWASGKDNYYLFDFGAVCDVDAYQLSFYRWAQILGGVKTWHIEYSLDGAEWNTCASGTQNLASPNENTYLQAGYLDQPVRAQFMKLVVDSVWDVDYTSGDTTKHTTNKWSALYEVKFFGTVAEEKTNPQLFRFRAGENSNHMVSSNSTYHWTHTVVDPVGTAPSFPVYSFYNNYDNGVAGQGGLPGEERIWFSLDNMRAFNTDSFNALQLSVRNLYVSEDSDINMNFLNQLQILYSTDNGVSFSDPLPVGSHYKASGYLELSNGKAASDFTLWTDDLLEVLPANTTITNLRVKPYGDYAEHFGALRLVEVDLTAYPDALPERIGDDMTDEIPTVEIPEETLRQIVVAQMMKVATSTCEVDEQVVTYNYRGSSLVGDKYGLTYPAGITLRGPFYTRTRPNTAAEWFAAVENGKYVGSITDDENDWANSAIGMDCAMITHDAIHTVSTAKATSYKAYVDPELTFLGELSNEGNLLDAPDILAAFTVEQYMEALALLKEGDLVVSFAGTNTEGYNGTVDTHVRLTTGAAVVVRDGSGKIDPAQSYVLCTEAGGAVYHYYRETNGGTGYTACLDENGNTIYYRTAMDNGNTTYLYSGSVRVNWKYTFQNLKDKYYIPMSLKVYETEQVEQFRARVFRNAEASLNQGIVRLVIDANYRIPFLDVTITDEQGQVVRTERVTLKGAYTFMTNFKDEATEAWIAEAPVGKYHYKLTTCTGPVLTVGGEVPTQTIFETDFTK